jgi:hypothetical protein
MLVYGLPLLVSLYGLKCVVLLRGSLPFGNRLMGHRFSFVPVHGAAAVLAGISYIALALFSTLSTGDPPPEHRKWFWRALRGLVRWGSLVAMFWFWGKASQLVQPSSPWPSLRLPEDFTVLGLLSTCLGIVAVLCFLSAMFQREAVKRELREQVCTPLHIWWRPAAYWVPWRLATGFRVIFRDPAGALHRAYCYTYPSLSESPFWGSRRVRWLVDTIQHRSAANESWVWADDEIVRPKLEEGGSPVSSSNSESA